MPSSDKKVHVPRFQPSEAFSTEELQSSLGKAPRPKVPVPELRMTRKKDTPEMAKTNRARRIANVLSGNPQSPPPNVPEQELLNHQARAALGELVSVFMKKGYYSELEAILQEHIGFCENILGLLKKQTSRKQTGD